MKHFFLLVVIVLGAACAATIYYLGREYPTTGRTSAESAEPKPARVEQGKQGEALYDFLHSEESLKEPQLSPQQTRQILNAVVGAGWEKRKDINPSIGDMVTGSFTAPKAQETAYVIRNTDPDPGSTIDMQNDSRLVVFSGTQLVFNAKFSGWGILRACDLNHDGIDELLLSGGWLWMGEDATTAQLVQVNGNRLQVIRDFEQVISAAGCDEEVPKNGRTVTSIIYYLPQSDGKWPRFRIDFYQGPCPGKDGKNDPKQFHLVQSGKIPL